MLEVAEFFAAGPSQDAILNFHSSAAVQQRASDLLEKMRLNSLTSDERRELDEFGDFESFMGLVKARIHAGRKA
jgi:hypothetical protein